MGKFASQSPSSLSISASHMPEHIAVFLRRKKWRGEISDTEPTRLTGLMSKGPELTSAAVC